MKIILQRNKMCRIPKVVKYFVYFSLFSMQWRSELLLRVWETIPRNRSIDHCLHHQKNHAIHQHADIIARNHSIYQFAFRFRFSIVDSRFFAVPFTNRWNILSFVVHTLGLVFFIFHYIFIYCLSRDFPFFLFLFDFFFIFNFDIPIGLFVRFAGWVILLVLLCIKPWEGVRFFICIV